MELVTLGLFSLFIATVVIVVLAWSGRGSIVSSLLSSLSTSAEDKAKLEPRLKMMRDFFEVLTNEKTAHHVGSGAMKNLRSMLALPDLEPAILRAWARALRSKAGVMYALREDTAQLQEGTDPKTGLRYTQVVCEAEFAAVDEKDAAAVRIDKLTTLCCLVRFRAPNAESDSGTTPEQIRATAARDRVAGWHVARPMREEQLDGSGSAPADPSQHPLLDITSNLDPSELDHFAERAVELLFDSRTAKDPMEAFFPYCIKPLQDLYDVASSSSSSSSSNDATSAAPGAAAASATAATTTTSGLPPKRRRERLALDIAGVKLQMGMQLPRGATAPNVSMLHAETVTNVFPNVKAVEARVNVEGVQKDSVVTLHIVLDSLSPYGCSIAKFSFGFGPSKQRTMLYDQDTGVQMACT